MQLVTAGPGSQELHLLPQAGQLRAGHGPQQGLRYAPGHERRDQRLEAVLYLAAPQPPLEPGNALRDGPAIGGVCRVAIVVVAKAAIGDGAQGQEVLATLGKGKIEVRVAGAGKVVEERLAVAQGGQELRGGHRDQKALCAVAVIQTVALGKAPVAL